MGFNEVNLSDSIGTKLLKNILGIYCLIAMALTVGHAVLEYTQEVEHVKEDISNYEPFLRHSLANAVWHLDLEQLNKILEDVAKNDEVEGVSVRGAKGELLAQQGLIAGHERDYPQLNLGFDSFKGQYVEGLVWYSFPILDPSGLQQGEIGQVTFYSSPKVVINKVKDTFVLILAAALIKTLLLCFLFVFFGRRLLGQPLSRVILKLRGLPLDTASIKETSHASMDEIQLLEVAIHTMEMKLQATLKQLHTANEALCQSNLVLQRATEQNPVGISIFAPDGEVIYTNPSFTRISGYSAEEAQYAYNECLYRDDPLPEKIRSLKGAELLNSDWIETQERAKDGRIYWVSTRLSPVIDSEGEESHALFISQEITELKQTALALGDKTREQQKMIQQLEGAQHQLLQSEKMASIGQLAAGVAHEINNPVGYVKSNLSTLARYAKGLLSVIETYDREAAGSRSEESLKAVKATKDAIDYEFLKEDLENLLHESEEGIERVKKIVQDLKDFSHADRGEWLTCDLHKGIESTLNVVWNELKYKAEVVKEFGELPLVHCIPTQLNQVIMNLLVNAAQAIEEQGVIHIRTGTDDHRVWLEISDSGKGIAAEHLAHLFEPFFTTKPVGTGTGLGLSVSYGIVKKHGGDIDVDSQPGKGSRFRVWIPRDSKQPH